MLVYLIRSHQASAPPELLLDVTAFHEADVGSVEERLQVLAMSFRPLCAIVYLRLLMLPKIAGCQRASALSYWPGLGKLRGYPAERARRPGDCPARGAGTDRHYGPRGETLGCGTAPPPPSASATDYSGRK